MEETSKRHVWALGHSVLSDCADRIGCWKNDHEGSSCSQVANLEYFDRSYSRRRDICKVDGFSIYELLLLAHKTRNDGNSTDLSETTPPLHLNPKFTRSVRADL